MLVEDFIKNVKYILVRYDKDYGKILDTSELSKVNSDENEIHRSIEYENDDRLFMFNMMPFSADKTVDNILSLLKNNIKTARMIESVYPNMFRWVYDGMSLKAYAIVPSGDPKQHSTISRYGGTEMFIRILYQHLDNIAKMAKGFTPDYNFIKNNREISETELAVGSIRKSTGMHSIMTDVNKSYLDIILDSKKNVQDYRPLNVLEMKYWAKEINPDFIVEAKNIQLKTPLKLDYEKAYELFPKAIKNIMALKHKGNFNRYLLSRFLLSVYSVQDAKFIYYSVLSPDELYHVKYGNCSTQWNYIVNNRKRYDCPTFRELVDFKDPEDEGMAHPLEKIQKYLDENEKDEN